MENVNYLELAKIQFNALMEDILDADRHALGAECEEEYEKYGVKFKIKVDGFWEKSKWFDWCVYDDAGNVIAKGTEL